LLGGKFTGMCRRQIHSTVQTEIRIEVRFVLLIDLVVNHLKVLSALWLHPKQTTNAVLDRL
jgi:hypothetical protein